MRRSTQTSMLSRYFPGSLLFVTLLIAVYIAAYQLYDNGYVASSWVASLRSSLIDPYTLPGYLAISTLDPHGNRWVPFNTAAYAPMIFAAFTRLAWKLSEPANEVHLMGDQAAVLAAQLAPDGRDWLEMEWVRGRTILYLGDSINRDHTLYMCQMLGAEYQLLSPGHAWWPDKDALPIDLENYHIANHMPHTCYVPGIDFLLIHVFTFGLDTQRHYAEREAVDRNDYVYEDRFTKFGTGIVREAHIQGGRKSPTPDAILLASAMWDSAKWMNEDIATEQPTDEGLSPSRLTWYIRRLISVLELATGTFPETPVFWVPNHYPIGPPTGSLKWLVGEAEVGNKRPAQQLNRLFQMNQAAHAAVSEMRKKTRRVDILPWGDLLLGQERHQRDDLHPAMYPAGYMFADVLLFKLWQYLA